MKKLQKIKKWIFENHEHHHSSESFSIELETGKEIREDGKRCKCADGNQAYVNSIKLEKFIEKLYETKN